jgi:hypothetical protein
VVAGNISGTSSFELGDLADGAEPLTLYIVTRGPDSLRLRPLVRLVFETCMQSLMGVELRFLTKAGKACRRTGTRC